jgi:hypothetical protein
MVEIKVNKDLFNLQYLPQFAAYLLEHHLKDFVTVAIRFSREAKLPILIPLERYTEEQLVELLLERDRKILEALVQNKMVEYIEEHAEKWITNTLGIVQRDEITAEDITLLFYLRRKVFAHFLDAYTKNVVLQKLIIGELDFCTTQEEMVAYNIYLSMQHDRLLMLNQDLVFHKQLLLEAQEMVGTGSFLLNIPNPNHNVYTPEYKKIFEIEDKMPFEEFMTYVHPDDRDQLSATITTAYQNGGNYEVEYRYNKSGTEKKIWSKGLIMSENGKPVFIRGIVKEISKG